LAKAVIFDVDGTLVDSVDLHARAWQDAFAEFGHDLQFPAIRSQIGKGGDQLLPVFLDDDEIEKMGKALEKRRGEILKERYLSLITPFPRVRELFERLAAQGIGFALASSAKSDELDHYKKITDIDDLIEIETSSDDAAKSKPHPDIFKAALDRLKNISPADVTVIGDTPYDAMAAGKAGLQTIGMLCGRFAEQDLKDAGCIAIYRDPADLIDRFDELPFARA